MKPLIEIYRLGRVPYLKALAIQQALFDKLKLDRQQHDSQKRSAKNSLLLLEHEPVYTVGIRSLQYKEDFVLKLKDRLAQHKLRAEFVTTNRGGLITFHGPGQLVAYPIINLGDFDKSIPNKSVKAYVKKLEHTIIDTLARVGIKDAHTVSEYPGVWLDGGDRKIAFVGIACKCYITMHGISINCDCDLAWFDHIVSCGIEGKAITSVRREMRATLATGTTMTGDIHTNCVIGSTPGISQNVSQSDTPEDMIPSGNGGLKISNLDHLSDSKSLKYGVQHVADAFCSSFSRHFECELQDR